MISFPPDVLMPYCASLRLDIGLGECSTRGIL